MDSLNFAFYTVMFQRDFFLRRGDAFQDFFSDIMERCHPEGDFVRVKPWGNVGDMKNDGYLKSTRTLFAVHGPAPNVPINRVIKKIDNDFRKGFPVWQKYVDRWVYVHNFFDGIPAPIEQKLEELDQEFPNVNITQWGFRQIERKVLSLGDADLIVLFGPVPSQTQFVGVGYDEIQIVVTSLAQEDFTQGDIDLRPFSLPEKMQHNELNNHLQRLLQSGLYGVNNVEKFFSRWSDPTLADRIAASFNRQYKTLREQNFPASYIFFRLQEMFAGTKRNSPEREVAILAVMAYFFAKCDFFERPPDKA